MIVTQHSELPRAALPGIEHMTLAGAPLGLKQLSVWRQSVAPGGATPPHRHDCEEVVLVHAGQGELHVNGQVHAFGPDTTVVVPRNAAHQIINVGRTPLELTGIFSTTPVQVFFPDGQPIELPWQS